MLRSTGSGDGRVAGTSVHSASAERPRVRIRDRGTVPWHFRNADPDLRPAPSWPGRSPGLVLGCRTTASRPAMTGMTWSATGPWQSVQECATLHFKATPVVHA